MADERGRIKTKLCPENLFSHHLHKGNKIWPDFTLTLEASTQLRTCDRCSSQLWALKKTARYCSYRFPTPPTLSPNQPPPKSITLTQWKLER